MLPIFLLIYLILLFSQNLFAKIDKPIVDDKLKFSHHIQNVQSKLGGYCGNIKNETLCTKIHPTEILYVEYQANITIWPARLRRHEFLFLKPILNMQRKIVRMICFNRKFDTITKFFSD